MYFDFPTYLKVIGLVLTDKPRPRRLVVQLGLLLLLSAWAVFNAFFLLLDALFFPRLRRVDIRAPVFIVGNARSGAPRVRQARRAPPIRRGGTRAARGYSPAR